MAQYNHVLENRGSVLPDDPLISQQWQYVNTGANGGVPNADLDADLAWDIATGGVTPAGDTIVMAVIDGGIDTEFIRTQFPERYALKAQDGILNPEHIAQQYVMLHRQPRDAWTHELDLRPWSEKF